MLRRARGAIKERISALPSPFWFLWLGMLLNALGGFLFTFLSLYLTKTRGLSVERAGLVVSLFGVGGMCAGPLGGALADRIGRRPTLLISTGLTAAAMLQLGWARATIYIGFSALLLGLLSGMWRPAAYAAAADLVPVESRTRAYALLYWASNLGFAGASVLAGMLARIDMGLLFVVDAASTLVFGGLVLLGVPETRPTEVAQGPRPALLAPYRDRVFVAFVLAQLPLAWMFWQANATLPLDMGSHGISLQRFGQLVSINGLLIVLLQPLAVTWVTRIPRARALAIGAFLIGLGFFLPALHASVPWYAASIAIWTLGEIVVTAVAPTLIADLAPVELRGSYQGGFQLSWGAASLLGPALGSLVLGRLGGGALWIVCLLLGVASAIAQLMQAPARRARFAKDPGQEAALRREDGLP
jgi:MFS family permease